MTEIEKFVENLILGVIMRDFDLGMKAKRREEKKEFEKICRWNRLLGFTDDKYKIIFSTRNSEKRKEKKKWL